MNDCNDTGTRDSIKSFVASTWPVNFKDPVCVGNLIRIFKQFSVYLQCIVIKTP